MPTTDTEMQALVAAHDWAATPLGPAAAWPQSLRTAVRIMLHSRYAMWMGWGPDLTFLYNDAYGRMTLGRKHPWALGRPAREVWAEIWPDIGPRIATVLRENTATWDEALMLFIERSGYLEETYHTFSYSPLEDDTGRVAGMLCVVTEETERVIGERRLATLQSLASELASVSRRADVLAAVERALTGDRRDLPFTLTYLFDPDDGRARLAAASGIAAGHAAAPLVLDGAAAVWPADELRAGNAAVVVDHLERRFRDLPTGAWARPPARAALVPVMQSGQGGAAGFLVAAINPFRLYDEAYEGFLGLLAGQIAAALASANVYEEERKRADALAALDRAKTAFFSNVSHEFRTPLTLMLGPLEDALASGTGTLSGADLATTHRNALRLLKLVNALLDYSRIEAGRGQARFQPTDLGRLTAEVASGFESAVERGGVRLVVCCDAGGEPVFVDREMWEKIVLNLVSNAFKFTPAGEIEVGLRRVDGAAELTVRDTGIGVPAADVPRLFERFHRVEGAGGRTQEGSGIGLALVSELVRMHGGTVAVASELGTGSTFTVRVPLGAEHLPAEHVSRDGGAAHASGQRAAFVAEALRWSAATEDAEPDAAEDQEDALIVLADDNADMREYLTRLRATRWRVHAVNDGVAALAAVRELRPTVVVSDIMMPRLDGFALLRELRADPGTRAIPVVMLSARAGEEARVEGLEAGADDYVVKPFAARELLARVATQVRITRLRTQIAHGQAAVATLFRETPVPIAVLAGDDLVFEVANDSYREVVGREVLGRPLAEALPELCQQGFDRLLREVMRTGRPHVGRETRIELQRDGRTDDLYFTFSYTPLRDEHGRNTRVIAICNDVTEQVHARRKVETLAAEAQAANRAKDEFLAMLGHELRNPLSPIVTALDILRLRGTRTREHDIIERQVTHLTRLVDDLLDVARITRGRIELKPARVELAPIVARALEIASPLLAQRANRVSVEVAADGLCVHADADRLAQVVSNLLTNAAKYGDVGSAIVVRAERVGALVRLRVRDHGVGIAAGKLQHVFDLFVQMPQTIERAIGGLGRGLTIVRAIVEMHGGSVRAESDGPGTGSEFIVELPAAAADAVGASRPEDGGAGQIALVRGRRVLIVDDNVDAALTLAEALRAYGHTVTVVHDGPAALQRVDDFRPDVALVDIGLPVMSGYEVARRLRACRIDVKLIAVTGYGQEADRRRSEEAGFAQHMVKPVRVESLLEMID